MRSRRLKPLPSRVYGAAFLLFAALLFGIFGYGMVGKMRHVNAMVQQQNALTAAQELKQAVEYALERIDSDVGKLVEWDEVHQQLSEPVYYAYWRKRLIGRSVLPSYVDAVELYDRDREFLTGEPVTGLPRIIPESQVKLKVDRGKLYLYRFLPVFSRKEKQPLIGFVGIKADFLRALHGLTNFVYTNPESVVLTPESDAPVSAGSMDILSVLDFKPVANSSSRELETLMLQFLQLGAALLLIMLLLFYAVIARLFTRPLGRLVAYIDMLRKGKPDTSGIQQNFSLHEIDVLHRSLNTYQEELNEMHHELDRRNLELRNMTRTDALTGVYNRRAFDDDWKNLQALTAGQRLDVAFLVFDCDRFKAINDSYGHDVGDRVIQIMAETLSGALRDGDKLYRPGGDEFATFLMNTNAESARILAERCLVLLQGHNFHELGIAVPVNMSVGYAIANAGNPGEIQALPKNADRAMYKAKETGRRRAICYNQGMAGKPESESNLH